jgi:hypothetical protein
VGLMPEFSGNSIHFNPNSSYRVRNAYVTW